MSQDLSDADGLRRALLSRVPNEDDLDEDEDDDAVDDAGDYNAVDDYDSVDSDDFVEAEARKLEAAARTAFSSAPPPPDDSEELIEERLTDTVIRRRRAKKEAQPTMTVANSTLAKTKTLDEIPRDQIHQLRVQGHTEVKLSIRRKTPDGKWSQIRNGLRMPPEALFSLQDVVQLYTGGGVYIYEVTDVATNQVLAGRWEETYDGTPVATPKDKTLVWNDEIQSLKIVSKDAAYGGVIDPVQLPYGHVQPQPQPYGNAPYGLPVGYAQANGNGLQQALVGGAPSRAHLYQQAISALAPQRDMQGQLLPPPPDLIPSWMRAYSPDVQWSHVLDARVSELEKAGVRPQVNGVTNPGNTLANEWMHHEIRQQGELKAEVASLRSQYSTLSASVQEKIDAAQREAQTKVDAMTAEKVRLEREVEQARADARYGVLEAKMLSLSNKPSFDWSSIAPLAAAFAPVATGLMSKGAESQRVQTENHTKLMTTLLENKKGDKGTPELLVALAPLVMPLLLKMMENNGPQAQAEMMQIEHEQRMMHLKMLADMTASSVDEKHPWAGVIEQAVGMFGGIMAGAGRQLPPPPRQLLQGAPLPAAQQAAAAHATNGASGTVNQGAPTVAEQMEQDDPQVAAVVEQVLKQLPQSLGFHTHEWRIILYNVHARQDVAELGQIIAEYLIHCLRFKTVPTPFVELDVFEKPQESLLRVFQVLPIATDAVYTSALIESIAESIQVFVQPDEDEDEGEEGGTVSEVIDVAGVDTPAVANGN